MRKKKDTLIITFSTTTEAIKMEKFCAEKGLPGRLIPVPREITAGCGLSWKAEPGEKDRLLEELEAEGITWEQAQVICI